MVKLNTNISIENVVTVLTIICSVILAFGFMRYDIRLIQETLDLKANKREIIADRQLIEYKLDVIIEDIEEIKQTLKEKK